MGFCYSFAALYSKKVPTYNQIKVSKLINFISIFSTQLNYGTLRRQIQTESVYNEIIELSVDLVKKSKPIKNKCFAIITDSTYTGFLSPTLFDVLRDKPLFMVRM
jgi:hypothetical protein